MAGNNIVIGALNVPIMDTITVQNYGTNDGKCRLQGTLGNIFSFIITDDWIKLGFNCTLRTYPNYGSYDDGTGLLGSIATNETNFLIIPSKMYKIEDVEYTLPLTENKLQILSAYNFSNNSKSRDLLENYASFHWSYFISIIAMMMLLTWTWSIISSVGRKISRKVRRELKRNKKSAPYVVMCAFLDQDQYPSISMASFSVLSICITLFFFLLVNCFMLNMISTDLVVVDSPHVINSYEDIISSDIRVLFLPGMDEKHFFEDAKENSIERKIWKQRSIINIVDERILNKLSLVRDQKLVLILRRWQCRVMANIIIQRSFEKGWIDMRGYIIDDPTDKKFSTGFIVSKRAPKVFKEYIHKRLQDILQYDLGNHILSLSNYVPDYVNYDPYISSRVDVAQMPPPFIRSFNTKGLFLMCAILMIVSLSILIFEKIRHRSCKQTVHVEDRKERSMVMTRIENEHRLRMERYSRNRKRIRTNPMLATR